ncbi:MAG: glycosyltransferase involved in cell wall biosynthesis, partial [Myxococcota bacterium]
MKLLVLTTSYPSGPSDAAGAFVAELSGVLQERGFSITTVAMELPGGPLAALEQGQIWSVGAALARMSVKARWAAAEADAILAHWLLPSALLGVALGRPTIGVAHGGDVRLLARMPWLRKALVTRLAGVVAVSREAGAALEALNTLVTPMGVHAADFGPPAVLPPGPLKALFIGRLVPIKGLPTLLAAMSRTPEATLTVVGAGPEARLAARASSNVTFVGAVGRHALGELLASHHVVCLPSRAGEGTPRVV